MKLLLGVLLCSVDHEDCSAADVCEQAMDLIAQLAPARGRRRFLVCSCSS